MVLIVALGLMGVAVTEPPSGGPLPIPPGSYSLTQTGQYPLGTQYGNATPNGPERTPVFRADRWAQFVGEVNATASYRITGRWTATAPTMVVIAWNALWTATSSVSYYSHGCGGWPGQFCPSSVVVTNTSGVIDVVVSNQNRLCTNPPDANGPCADLGGGLVQAYFVGNAATPAVSPGTAVLSVVFVSFEPDTVTVVETIALSAA